MVQPILSYTAIILAAGYVFLRLYKERSLPACAAAGALLSSAAIELFDFLSLRSPEEVLFWKRISLLSESLLPFMWLSFSLTFSRTADRQVVPSYQWPLLFFSLLFVAAAAVIPDSALFYSPDFRDEKVLFLGNGGYFFYIGILLYMILSLINLEATLRAASRAERWKIKFETIGAGVMVAVFIFYYSQGLLYRSINMNLMPVRSLILIMSISLMTYSRIRRGNSVKLQVSQNLAYKSVVIFVVAFYFIWLGLVGEGLRYFGGDAQRTISLLLAFVAGVIILSVFLSETLRRKIELFINRNFYVHKYDYRVQWLQFTDRISSARNSDDLLMGILLGFSETFGAGGAVLYLLNHETAVFRGVANIEMQGMERTFPADDKFMEFLRLKGLFIAEENGEDIQTEDRIFFRNQRVIFVIPLMFKHDMEGFIVLSRPVNAHEIYTHEDYDLMQTLAKQATSAILNLRLSEELSRSREMETVGKLTTFVIHDMKNSVSTLSLILANAKNYMDNPDFQKDMLQSIDNTVTRMNKLIVKLKNIRNRESMTFAPADLHQVVAETVSLIGKRDSISLSGVPTYVMIDSDGIQRVVMNLLINAIEAGEENGPVTVEVGCREDAGFVRVSDCGCGMSVDFIREQLFKPFRTTKAKGLGIGLYQSKQIVDSHGGRIEIRSEIDKGSVFTVLLPLAGENETGPVEKKAQELCGKEEIL
ncbi:MAG: PEP-CTERM system histidine kinase PrsK [Nitrospirales bacterium]|nr:PEP-CTERM system histidine kinase PrsK [Nitrospirales bacterium]